MYWSILENMYRYYKEKSEFWARAGGAMVGAVVAVTMSHPFDVIKTRLETKY
jgi:hypothetical protein